MRTEYNNERKQWETINKPLLGALYTSNILAAPISLLRTHVLFYRKEKLPGIWKVISFIFSVCAIFFKEKNTSYPVRQEQ